MMFQLMRRYAGISTSSGSIGRKGPTADLSARRPIFYNIHFTCQFKTRIRDESLLRFFNPAAAHSGRQLHTARRTCRHVFRIRAGVWHGMVQRSLIRKPLVRTKTLAKWNSFGSPKEFPREHKGRRRKRNTRTDTRTCPNR